LRDNPGLPGGINFSESRAEPAGHLVRAPDGLWYGLTRAGGLFGGEDFGVGTLFRLIPEVSLEIFRNGSQLMVRWEHECMNHILEHSPALGPEADWQPWTGELLSGSIYHQTVVQPDTRYFFRLRKAEK